MKRLQLALSLAIVAALATSAQSVRAGGGAGWTKDWHCQLNGDETHHRITEASIDDWADGTHEYWPGDCAVHEEAN